MQSCDQCEKYLDKNFCASCGNRIESNKLIISKLADTLSNFSKETWYDILSKNQKNELKTVDIKSVKEKIRKEFIGSEYLVLRFNRKIGMSEQIRLKELLPASLEKIKKKFDPTYEGFDYYQQVSYARGFENIFRGADFVDTVEGIFIIDITELEVKEPIALNDNRMMVYIKDIEIYTKDEYEKIFVPSKECTSNWIEEKFHYRTDIYTDFFCNPYYCTTTFEPFIKTDKNKIYIISSRYSKIINEYVKKKYRDEIDPYDLSCFYFGSS